MGVARIHILEYNYLNGIIDLFKAIVMKTEPSINFNFGPFEIQIVPLLKCVIKNLSCTTH